MVTSGVPVGGGVTQESGGGSPQGPGLQLPAQEEPAGLQAQASGPDAPRLPTVT